MKKRSGSDYRAKNRARLQKFYKRQAAVGKKRISALLSGDTYNLIINEKNKTGATISDIIEAAVLSKLKTRKATSKTSADVMPQTTVDTSIPAQLDLFNQDNTNLIPDFTNRIMETHERDKVLIKVAEAMPGRHNSKARLNLLNKKAVPVNTRPGQYGGKWNQKKFTDNLRLARKRIKTNPVSPA